MKIIIKIFLLTVSNYVCSISFGQQLSKNLNIHLIKNINWQDFDHKQVQFFEDIFLKKNVLVLSETDHGDGSSYEAQCMILKGLIDSSKINTIYTESSWIIIDKINDILKKEGIKGIEKTFEYMQSVELRYWAGNGFWKFLANKIIEGKVVLRGFDVGASENIVSELFRESMALNSVKTYIKANKKDFEEIKFDYQNFDGWQVASTFYEDGYKQQKKFIDSVREGYKITNNLYRIKQWQAILDFFYWMYKRTLILKENKYLNISENDKQESAFMSIRDSLMASHFLETYSANKDKSVILISSYHAMRNSNSIEGLNDCCKDPFVNIMGEILDKKIGKEIYNMCFITSSGERGINYYFTKQKVTKIPPPKIYSLEYKLKDISTPYAVIDFERSSLSDSSFYMCPIFYKYLKSNWYKNFSGLFFIKEMKPLVLNNPVVYQGVENSNSAKVSKLSGSGHN